MIYYIIKWEDQGNGIFTPVYAPEDETPEDLKQDDDFKFVGELDSPEFEKHFQQNIALTMDN